MEATSISSTPLLGILLELLAGTVALINHPHRGLTLPTPYAFTDVYPALTDLELSPITAKQVAEVIVSSWARVGENATLEIQRLLKLFWSRLVLSVGPTIPSKYGSPVASIQAL